MEDIVVVLDDFEPVDTVCVLMTLAPDSSRASMTE